MQGLSREGTTRQRKSSASVPSRKESDNASPGPSKGTEQEERAWASGWAIRTLAVGRGRQRHSRRVGQVLARLAVGDLPEEVSSALLSAVLEAEFISRI